MYAIPVKFKEEDSLCSTNDNSKIYLLLSQTPYCIVRLENESAARRLIARSVLAKQIFELWGQGSNYEELHAEVRNRTAARWPDYKEVSFRFSVESFAGKRTPSEKAGIIQSFAYMNFQGPIRMTKADEAFWVLEEYISEIELMHQTGAPSARQAFLEDQERPRKVYFTRWLSEGSREMITRYDLKKRRYISTTSMDAELALVTANMVHAAPGKLFFDPFVGTGSFCIAAAHFGALTIGADIDGRSFRGKQKAQQPIGLVLNFQQYGLECNFVDAFISDLTNTPIRDCQFLDGIICDPPYGVREGLKVLGSRDGRAKEAVMIDGVPAH